MGEVAKLALACAAVVERQPETGRRTADKQFESNRLAMRVMTVFTIQIPN
jgi:hypothetical protein